MADISVLSKNPKAVKMLRAAQQELTDFVIELHRHVFAQVGVVKMPKRLLNPSPGGSTTGVCVLEGKDANGVRARQRVFLKRGGPPADQRSRISHEYKTLADLSALHNREVAASLPAPLGYSDELDCLALDYFGGSNLLRLMAWRFPLWAVAGVRTMSPLCYQLGSWLGAFQQLAATGRTAALTEDVEQCTKAVAALAEIRTEDERQSIERFLDTLSRARITLPEVVCHGDFVPRNVIITQEGVTVVDWEWSRPGNPFLDVNAFLLNLESRRRHLPFLLKPIRRMQRAFLKGYAQKSPESHDLALIETTMCLYIINYLARRRGHSGRSWRRFARTLIERILCHIQSGGIQSW